MEALVNRLRASFNTGVTKSAEWRRSQLLAMEKLVNENIEEICESLKQDLNKSTQESMLNEISLINNSITYSLKHLDDVMQPQKVTPIFQVRTLYSTLVQYQPYGVVLNISAWNYPYQLSLVPIIGAIACGNCAILKPSEVAPKSAELLEKLWSKYFDPNFIALVNGGADVTIELLKQRFDYIFYTGSTMIGKSVMRNAAEHMTPVTLECGGKNPVYIDANSDLNISAKRILWGKFSNAGQTCIAPDYVLCTKETQEKLLPIMKQIIVDFYGPNPKDSNSFGRIINKRHFERLMKLINKDKVVIGGDSNADEKYISPTVMFGVKPEDKVMQEEIFGPILSFITVADHKEAIQFINQNEKSLALYVFTNDNSVFEDFRVNTSSGAIGLNEVLIHVAMECLPFGGVGDSGIGRYHGKYSFDTFSHQRAVIKASFCGDALTSFRYPPYSTSNTSRGVLATSEIKTCTIL